MRCRTSTTSSALISVSKSIRRTIRLHFHSHLQPEKWPHRQDRAQGILLVLDLPVFIYTSSIIVVAKFTPYMSTILSRSHLNPAPFSFHCSTRAVSLLSPGYREESRLSRCLGHFGSYNSRFNSTSQCSLPKPSSHAQSN